MKKQYIVPTLLSLTVETVSLLSPSKTDSTYADPNKIVLGKKKWDNDFEDDFEEEEDY